MILATGEIEPADLGLAAGAPAGGTSAPAAARTLRDLERRAIEDALRESSGNRKRAAARLGIALRTLQYKLKEFGINLSEPRKNCNVPAQHQKQVGVVP